MTTLTNGSFVFIGENKQLHLLEKGTHQKPYVIYGGKVLAFACGEASDFIALALPSGHEKVGAYTNGQRGCVVRLYRFADGELGEMVGEMSSNLTISQLLWVGLRFLVACGPDGSVIYTWKNERLVLFVTDPGVSAHLQGDRLGLLQKERKTIEFWDLEKNRKVDDIKFSPRKGSNERRLIAVTGSGCFTFVLYDDGTVEVFYATTPRVKKAAALEGLFHSKDYAEGDHELVACALSPRKVLLGRRGDSRVLKLEYRKGDTVAVGLQEDLPTPLTLLAISTDGRRCLTINTESSEYRTTVLNFSASRLSDAASTSEVKTPKGAHSVPSRKGDTATAGHDSGEGIDSVKDLPNGSGLKTDVSSHPKPATPKPSPVVGTTENKPNKATEVKNGSGSRHLVFVGTLVSSLLIGVYAVFRFNVGKKK